jgi:hypothetical protein
VRLVFDSFRGYVGGYFVLGFLVAEVVLLAVAPNATGQAAIPVEQALAPSSMVDYRHAIRP